MELREFQAIVTNALEQIKSDQYPLLVHWLDDLVSKYRLSNLTSIPTQSILPPRTNHGSRLICACGRSFVTEITFRETTNVESSSPPATPMVSSKTDLKHRQYVPLSSTKRAKLSPIETINSVISTTAHNSIGDRLHQSGNISNWSLNDLKHHENSPELLTTDSNRAESDIELSSDDSQCLDELDAVLSPDKTSASNLLYLNSLWPAAVPSSTSSSSLSFSNNHQENPYQHSQIHRHLHHHHHHSHQQDHQRQIMMLKEVVDEPLSPVDTLLQNDQGEKTVVPIHRPPILIASNHPDACSSTGPTYFKCTQCHETFDSLLHGQEHVNNGMCISDTTENLLDQSDQPLSPTSSPLFDSLQENMEEPLHTRLDSKAACPICKKIFSSVHTMIRHKTSIHDRQVRYGCNICGRFFFRKDKLTSHMVYHQDFNTYVCCICSLGFKSRMLMRQHLKRDHSLSGSDTGFNDILNQCQVKRNNHSQTNVSTTNGAADRQITTPLKRSINHVLAESDLKPLVSD